MTRLEEQSVSANDTAAGRLEADGFDDRWAAWQRRGQTRDARLRVRWRFVVILLAIAGLAVWLVIRA
jgi:hypothetical protein